MNAQNAKAANDGGDIKRNWRNFESFTHLLSATIILEIIEFSYIVFEMETLEHTV